MVATLAYVTMHGDQEGMIFHFLNGTRLMTARSMMHMREILVPAGISQHNCVIIVRSEQDNIVLAPDLS